MSIEIKITSEYDGVKPKNFIKKKIDVPFSKIVDLLKDKRITINGKKIKKETVLREGDVLKVWPHDINLREVVKNQKESKNLGLEVICDTDDFVVFNKLPNVVVQGAQHNNMSISLHLAWYKQQLKDDTDFEYFHVHRLDKDTSGCVVVAKNNPTLRDFNHIFRTREVTKKYLCLVVGEPEEASGKIEVLMKRNPEGSREKMSITNNKNDKEAKKSVSNYEVLETFETEDDIFSLIEVEIKTGLTHQIRVHMKHLGCPILGDKMYGNSIMNQKYEDLINRQFLHAVYIGFDYNGQKYDLTASLTPDLQKVMEYLENK